MSAIGAPKAQEIIRRERAWHDEEGHQRRYINRLLYNSPAFDAVVQAALTFLEAGPGGGVLDLGCGEGDEGLTLARSGDFVIGVDLSHAKLLQARRACAVRLSNGRIGLVQANAEELPFASDTFRKVYGKAVLHHVNLDSAAAEIRRLLAPGGRATFIEPLAHHPLFWLGRRLTPRWRTLDEHPLSLAEFLEFALSFPRAAPEVMFLLAPLAYPLRLLPFGEMIFRWCHAWLQRVDGWLFAHCPALRLFAWCGLLRLQRHSA